MTCNEETYSANLVAVYAQEQSAQGTGKYDYDASHAIAVQSVNTIGAPRFSVPRRKGSGPGQAAIAPIQEEYAISGTLGGPLIPSGGTGGTCNIHPLLKASGFMDVDSASDTTVSGGSSTTTSVDVSDASNYTAFVSAVEISGELRWVTAVDSVSTPNNITVYPPLSSAPADTTAVNGVTTYRTGTNTHLTQNHCTVHAITGGGANLGLLVDAVISSLSLAAEMEGEVKYEMQLEGGSGGESSRLTLSGSLGTGDTSIPVNESGTGVPPIGARMQVKDGSELGMTVTASVSSGSFTATRGSSPDTGSSGDKLDYYVPGYTIPETAIPARSGVVYFGDTSVCDAGVTINVNNDLQKVRCRSSLNAFCRVSPGEGFEAGAEVTVPWSRESYGAVRASYMAGYDKFAAIFGSSSGKTAAVFAQKATVLELPGMDASGGGAMEGVVPVKFMGNSDTERPVVIAIQ